MSMIRKFNKGAEFWLGRYYDTGTLCFSKENISKKFGLYIVNSFKKDSSKEELCSLIDKSFSENFSSFSITQKKGHAKNCFEKGPIHYDDKFKYIRLPSFRSEELKNFELRISINPCLSNNNAMTKIYCNSILHENIEGNSCIEFLKRSNVICNTVNELITKMYSYFFINFIKNEPSAHINLVDEESFSNFFSLISTFIGSNDESTKKFINSISTENSPRESFIDDLKFFIRILNETNLNIGVKFKANEYKWRTLSTSPKNSHKKSEVTNAILGYAENQNLGHIIGVSDNTPRKILLPLHVKFIQEN